MEKLKNVRFLRTAFVFALILSVSCVMCFNVLPGKMASASADTTNNQGDCDLYSSFYASNGVLIPGLSIRASKVGQSDVKSFNFSSERTVDNETQTYGEIASQELFYLTKRVDKASPRLLKALMNSEKLQRVEIKAYMLTESGTEYIAFTIVLKGVTIVGRKVFTDPDFNNTNFEELALQFDQQRETAVESKQVAMNPSTIMGTICQMSGQSSRNIIGTRWQRNLTSGFYPDSIMNELKKYENTKELTPTLILRKQLDKASPKLQLAYETDEPFTVTLNTSQDPDGDGSANLTYVSTLKDATIISRRIFSEITGYNITKIYEELTLSYEGISETDILSKVTY